MVWSIHGLHDVAIASLLLRPTWGLTAPMQSLMWDCACTARCVPLNAGDIDTIASLLAPDVEYHDMIYEEPFRGREEVVQFLKKVRAGVGRWKHVAGRGALHGEGAGDAVCERGAGVLNGTACHQAHRPHEARACALLCLQHGGCI